jgi:hypothetical protein
MVAKDNARWKDLLSHAGRDEHLTTQETRDAAMAILESVDLKPGDALKHYPNGWSANGVV